MTVTVLPFTVQPFTVLPFTVLPFTGLPFTVPFTVLPFTVLPFTGLPFTVLQLLLAEVEFILRLYLQLRFYFDRGRKKKRGRFEVAYYAFYGQQRNYDRFIFIYLYHAFVIVRVCGISTQNRL